MEALERYVKKLANICLMSSLFMIAALMFLTAVDVIGRYFGHSVIGAYQISEIMELWLICLAWPFTESVKGHIDMDIAVSRLSRPAQHRIEVFGNFVTLGVFCLITWQGMVLVKRNFELGELVPIIQIPLSPFQLVIPVAAATNCLVLIVRWLRSLGCEANRLSPKLTQES